MTERETASEAQGATVSCRAGRSLRILPAKTALLVIDMQHDFLSPGGLAAETGETLAGLQAIVPRLQRLVPLARHAGMTVVHTREGYAADLSDLPAARRATSEVGRPGPRGLALVRGEPGHDFIDELRPEPGEWVIDKPGFGAFYHSDLELRLRSRGIDSLILTGVTTQCCVESTLREAVDRSFHCLLLEDCCAAYDPRLHQATLAVIQGEGHLFGWISDSDTLIAALTGG